MLTLLAVLGVLAALFLAAALATREDQALAPAPPDAAGLDLPDRPLGPDDVRGVRFGLALRGYRMREVDLVLDRLAAELAERDRRLEALGQGPDAQHREADEPGPDSPDVVVSGPAAAEPGRSQHAEPAPDDPGRADAAPESRGAPSASRIPS